MKKLPVSYRLFFVLRMEGLVWLTLQWHLLDIRIVASNEVGSTMLYHFEFVDIHQSVWAPNQAPIWTGVFQNWSNHTNYSEVATFLNWRIAYIVSSPAPFEVGLSQLCSKICPKGFPEFPKNFTFYASQCFYYACIMHAPKLPTILIIVMENFK